MGAQRGRYNFDFRFTREYVSQENAAERVHGTLKNLLRTAAARWSCSPRGGAVRLPLPKLLARLTLQYSCTMNATLKMTPFHVTSVREERNKGVGMLKLVKGAREYRALCQPLPLYGDCSGTRNVRSAARIYEHRSTLPHLSPPRAKCVYGEDDHGHAVKYRGISARAAAAPNYLFRCSVPLVKWADRAPTQGMASSSTSLATRGVMATHRPLCFQRFHASPLSLLSAGFAPLPAQRLCLG